MSRYAGREVVTFSNISATTAAFTLYGGQYGVTVNFSGAGSVAGYRPSEE